MTRLMTLVQHHLDRYGVRRAEFARRVGISPQAMQSWIDRPGLPRPEHLRSVADQLDMPYHRVLDAALTDAGYRDSDIDDAATVSSRIVELVRVEPAALRTLASVVSGLMAPLSDQTQTSAVDRVLKDRLLTGLNADDGENGGHQIR